MRCPGSWVCVCACVCATVTSLLGVCAQVHQGVHTCVRAVTCASICGGAPVLATRVSRGKQRWTLGCGIWTQLLEGSTLYICIYLEIYIIITSGPPSWLAREVRTMRPSGLFVWVWALSTAVCADACCLQWLCLCVCFAHVCMWLGKHLSLTIDWTWGTGAVQPHLLQGCWMWLPSYCSLSSPIHVAPVSELSWARATQTQGRESPWGPQGMHVSSPSLTYIHHSFESFWTQLNTEFLYVPCESQRPVPMWT